MQIVTDSYGRISSTASKTWSVTVNGTTYSGTNTIGIGNNATLTVASGTTTIGHNSDGTKSFSFSFSQQFNITFSKVWVGTISGSGSGTLNTIPRATQPSLSASSVAMGSAITISMPRASSGFTHTLTYVFGNASGTIGSGLGTSASWTLPMSLANQIPSATSGVGTIYCKTYSGSTLIGQKAVGFTATVPSSVVPSISSITCTDPTGNLAKYGRYVQGKSTVKVVASASGSYSSSITAYRIVANGTTYTSNSPTTGALRTSGTNTITVTVTDSRGRTATKSTTISVLAYATPTISYLTVGRCNSSGTADENGAYISAAFRTIVTALNSKNSASAKLEYKKSTASAWTTAGTYTAYDQTKTVVFAADTDFSYNIRVTVADNFSSGTYAKDVGTVFALMDFRSTGKGIALGKVAEEDSLDVNLTTRFRQPLRSVGDVIAGLGTSNQVSLQKIQSHVGMIIHTTTLDTMAKVIAIYGGTTWKKIEGKFLLGQSSSYAINSTGGSKDAIIPYHRHGIPSLSGTAATAGAHGHSVAYTKFTPANWTVGNGTLIGGDKTTSIYVSSSGSHTHSVTTTENNTKYVGTNGNVSGANMPPYKTVYIWERTA